MNNGHTEKEIIGIDLHVLAVDLLRGAKRFLWLGVLLVLCASVFFTWRTWRGYSPVYRASASFTVFVTNPLYAESRTYNSNTAKQMEKTFPYILTSGALSDVVKQKLGMSTLPPISASVLENTNIFTLSVTSGDPQLAYDVLNAVIECYPSVAEFVVGPTQMNLLDESGVPAEPVNHRDYPTAVKKGVEVGVVLWVCAVLLFALTRSTIHNEGELERMMNLRCIAQLPMAKGRRTGKSGTSCPMLSRGNDRFAFGESVRLLRLRLEKELREQGGKVILISSAIPGEGKTTVAVNLALSLAYKGKKTLLIDCDLRNPSVAAVFGGEGGPGLSDYLNRKAGEEEILRPLAEENLYAVFGGAPVSNASELLARREARELVELARETFDYVILDTPPCSLLADAAELAELADCAVMVIRQNTASRSRILDGVRLMSDSGLRLAGCVLNGVERGMLKSGGGYSGYYGYSGYGSGYGD